MREIDLNELKHINGGDIPWWDLAWEAAKAIYKNCHQDNGGPSATWENNGGYIG